MLILAIPVYCLAARIDSFTNNDTLNGGDEFVLWDAVNSATRNINWDDFGDLITQKVELDTQQFINVCEPQYNIDCTGATTETIDFQSVVDVAVASGQGILIPSGKTIKLDNTGGTYTIDSDITATTMYGGININGDLTISAYGATIDTPTTLSGSNNGSIFYSTTSGIKITIQGGTYQGRRDTWSGMTAGTSPVLKDTPYVDLFQSYGVSDITIKDTTIDNFSGNCIAIYGSDTDSTTIVNNIKILNNTLSECSARYPDYQHSGAVVSGLGNEGNSLPSSWEHSSLEIVNAENVDVIGNFIDRSWGDATRFANVEFMNFTNNKIKNTKMGAIFFRGVRNSNIEGNVVWTDQSDYADTADWTVNQTTGSGLDDLSILGYEPKWPVASQYLAEICVEGTPDTFRVKRDSDDWSECYAMTLSPSVLVDSWIKFEFAATTGHTAGDQWTITPVGYARGSRGITVEDEIVGSETSQNLNFVGNTVYQHGREAVWLTESKNVSFKSNQFIDNGRKDRAPVTPYRFDQGANSNVYIDTLTGGTTETDKITLENNTLIASNKNLANIRINGEATSVKLINNNLGTTGTSPTDGDILYDDRFMNPADGNWYRCILNHAASSDKEPGVGASWATYWELDNLDRTTSDTTPSKIWELTSVGGTGPYFNAIDGENHNPIVNQVDYSGDLCIGCLDPEDYRLVVRGDTNSTAKFIHSGNSSSSGGAGLQIFADDGAALASGDRLGFMIFGGSYQAGSTHNATSVSSYASQNWTSSNRGSTLRFETTLTNANSRAERMRISEDGYLGVNSTSPGAQLEVNGDVSYTPQTVTVADSGDANPATSTLTPTGSNVQITCNDTDSCDITMGETGIDDGQILNIVNVSANTVDFADTSGVSELTGAIALGQYDTLQLLYTVDRWVMLGTSNN